jgi:ribosome-associated translation inhibitor RaiA
MRFRYHSRTHIANAVRETVDRDSKLLDERLAHVEDDLKLLDISFDYHLRSDTYTAKLVLHVLDRTLAASATAERQTIAIRQAFEELYRQLDEFIAKLKHEPEIRDEQRKPAWLPNPSLPID